MRNVTLDEAGLRIDGTSVPLISGQFEYWRHNPLFWERLLGLIKDAGLDMVATFVCWEHHEVERGGFDFTGRTFPTRDLAGWLDLCQDSGLQVLLRVGPIIDAGWSTHGPPLDVCTKERLDPEFLQRTREYLDALSEVAVPRQIHRGGPIVAISLDNEIFFPYEDLAPAVGSVPVPYDEDLVLTGYREWLERRNGSIEALNDAWGTALTSFEDVGTPNYKDDSRAQSLTSFDYITKAIRGYFSQLSSICTDVGFELPTFVNTRPHTEYIDWLEIEEVVDSQGINAYAGAMLPGEQGIVANWYCRLQSARRRLFWAPEFQAGETMGNSGSTLELQTPEHFRYYNHFAMALGLRGLNWYMFIERDDWLWCPVNPVGKLRSQYEIAKDHVRILRQLAPDRQIADLGLLWFLEHNQAFMAEHYSDWTELQLAWAELDSPREYASWWSAFRSLLDTDADFTLIDPRASSAGLPRHLIYAGPDFVRRADWELITAAVEDDTTMIAATPLPENDLSGEFDEHLAALNARLMATGRVIEGEPAAAAATAMSYGAPSYVVTRPAGLWSCARRHGDVWTISVINPTERAIDGTLQLSDAIGSTHPGLRVTALVADTVVQNGGPLPSHMPVHLGGKAVELFQVEPA